MAPGPGRARGGWGTLAKFWIVLLVFAGVGGAVLQMLGPPGPGSATAPVAVAGGGMVPEKLRSGPAGDVPGHGSRGDTSTPATPAAAPAAPATAPTSAANTRPPGAPIPAPLDALLEPAPNFPGSRLPRAGTDAAGHAIVPMKAYAGGFDPADKRPRVALLLAGMGLSAANSDGAIKQTPAAVTLAYSPYAVSPDLTQARALGHELVVSIPMEAAGAPLEDAGPQALLTGSTVDENRQRLEWALSRIQGYAGTTSALGLLRGERFARADPQMAPVLADLAVRGLYYIDTRVGTTAVAGRTRGIDLIIDSATEQAGAIDANLTRLEQMAVDRGATLGLVGAPWPVTVERIAAWAGKLASHGVVLVPVSALLGPPPTTTAPAPAMHVGAAK